MQPALPRTPEIPPRARGRDVAARCAPLIQGNTPACAGKSAEYSERADKCWKYPRVRGEESFPACHCFRSAEIPPRARGRGSRSWTAVPCHGNTPACAGKSLRRNRMDTRPRKYPRVRGEEEGFTLDGSLDPEIPPRARGRVSITVMCEDAPGNTPACAGKSRSVATWCRRLRKYPRVRGEESLGVSANMRWREIPPRARGRGCGKNARPLRS